MELTYAGLNHSDSTLVMRLPSEGILFAVDFLNGGAIGGRGFIDSYPLKWEQSIEQVLKMDRRPPPRRHRAVRLIGAR